MAFSKVYIRAKNKRLFGFAFRSVERSGGLCCDFLGYYWEYCEQCADVFVLFGAADEEFAFGMYL